MGIIKRYTEEALNKDKSTYTLDIAPPQTTISSYVSVLSTYEKNILLCAIRLLEAYLKEEKLTNGFSVKPTDSNGSLLFNIPLSALLEKEKDKNYTRIKQGLYSLLGRRITIEDNGLWKSITLIEKPEIKKWRRIVNFVLNSDVSKALLNLGQNLSTSLSLKGSYAIQFFNFLPRTNKPVKYSLDKLKSILGVENKYKDTNKFINTIILSAQRELDKSSPFTFTYTTIKTGKKITGFTFTPVKNKQVKAINPPKPIKAIKAKANPTHKTSPATKPKKPKPKPKVQSSQPITPPEITPITPIEEPESKNKGSWVKRMFKRLLGRKG